MSKGRIEQQFFDKKTQAIYKVIHQVQIKTLNSSWFSFDEIDLKMELRLQAGLYSMNTKKYPTFMKRLRRWELFRNYGSSFNSYRVLTQLYKKVGDEWVEEEF